MPHKVKTHYRTDRRTGRKVRVNQHDRKGGRRGPRYGHGGNLMRRGFRARRKHGGLVASAIVTVGALEVVAALTFDTLGIVLAVIGGLLVLVSVMRFGSPR